MSAQISDEKILKDLDDVYAYLCRGLSKDGKWHDLQISCSVKQLIKGRLGCTDSYAAMILTVLSRTGLVAASHAKKVLTGQKIDQQACLNEFHQLQEAARKRYERKTK